MSKVYKRYKSDKSFRRIQKLSYYHDYYFSTDESTVLCLGTDDRPTADLLSFLLDLKVIPWRRYDEW